MKKKASMLCAAVDFLSSRYSPAGYICGYPCKCYNGKFLRRFPEHFCLSQRAGECDKHRVFRRGIEKSDDKNDNPVDDCSSRKVNEISGNSDTVYNAETCVSVLDHFITLSGNTSWIVLLSISEMSQPNTVKSISASVEGGGFIGTAVYYDKVSDSISAVPMYQAISRGFDSAAAYGMKLVGMTGENNLAGKCHNEGSGYTSASLQLRGSAVLFNLGLHKILQLVFMDIFIQRVENNNADKPRAHGGIRTRVPCASSFTRCGDRRRRMRAVAAVPRKMNLSSCPYIGIHTDRRRRR